MATNGPSTQPSGPAEQPRAKQVATVTVRGSERNPLVLSVDAPANGREEIDATSGNRVVTVVDDEAGTAHNRTEVGALVFNTQLTPADAKALENLLRHRRKSLVRRFGEAGLRWLVAGGLGVLVVKYGPTVLAALLAAGDAPSSHARYYDVHQEIMTRAGIDVRDRHLGQ